MKSFLAILLIVLAVQPAPVMSCEMHGDAGGDAHAGMAFDMDHGDGHDMADPAAEHDCCDDDGSDRADCPATGCLACAVTVVAISAPAFQATAVPATAGSWSHQDRLAPSHDSHPFRPPRLLS